MADDVCLDRLPEPGPVRETLPATLRLGASHLTVADVDRYCDALGFTRVEAAGPAAEDAVGGFLVRDPWGTAVTLTA